MKLIKNVGINLKEGHRMKKDILIIVWYISLVWGGLELLVWISDKKKNS